MFFKGKRFSDTSNSSGTVPGPGDYNPVDLNTILDKKEPRATIQRFNATCNDTSGMHAPRSLVNLVKTSHKSEHLTGTASSSSLPQNRLKHRATFDHQTKSDLNVLRSQRGASCDSHYVSKDNNVQPRVPTHVCEPRLARERPRTVHVFNEGHSRKSEVSSKVPSHILSPKQPTQRATTTAAALSTKDEESLSTRSSHPPRATTYSPRENPFANPGRSLESQSSSKMYNRQRDIQSAFGVRSDSVVDKSAHAHHRPDEGQQKRSKRQTSAQSAAETRDVLQDRCKPRPTTPSISRPVAVPPRAPTRLQTRPTRGPSAVVKPAATAGNDDAVEYSNDEGYVNKPTRRDARSVAESDFGFTSTTTFDIESDNCSDDKDTVIPRNVTPPSERDAELCDEELYINCDSCYLSDAGSTPRADTPRADTPRHREAGSRVMEVESPLETTKPKPKESLRSKREDAAFEKFVNKCRNAGKPAEPMPEPLKLSAVASRRRMRNAFVSDDRVKTTIKQRAHDAAVKSKLVEVPSSPQSSQPVERVRRPVKTMLWCKKRVLMKKTSKKSLGMKSNPSSGGSTRRSARRNGAGKSSEKLEKITHLEVMKSEEVIGDATNNSPYHQEAVYVQDGLLLSNTSSYENSLGGDSYESYEDASQELIPLKHDESSELVQLYTRADSNRLDSNMNSDMEITVNTQGSGVCVDVVINNANTKRQYSTRDVRRGSQRSIENRVPRKKVKINVADNTYRSNEDTIRKYRLRHSGDPSETREVAEDECEGSETSGTNDEVELSPGRETAITWNRNEVITIDSTSSMTSVFLQNLDKSSKCSLVSNQTSSTHDSADSRRQLVIKGGNRGKSSPKHSFTSAEKKISRNLMLQREKSKLDDEQASPTRKSATQPVKSWNASSRIRTDGHKEEQPVAPNVVRRVRTPSRTPEDRRTKEGDKSDDRNVKINIARPKSRGSSVKEDVVPKNSVSSPDRKSSPQRSQNLRKQVETPSRAASKSSSKGVTIRRDVKSSERESSPLEKRTRKSEPSPHSHKEVTKPNAVQNEETVDKRPREKGDDERSTSTRERKSSIHEVNVEKEKVSQTSRDLNVEKPGVCQNSESPTSKPSTTEMTTPKRNVASPSRKSTDRERKVDSAAAKAESGRKKSVPPSSRKSSITSEKDSSPIAKRGSITSSRKSSVSPPSGKSSVRTPKGSLAGSKSSASQSLNQSFKEEKESKSSVARPRTQTSKTPQIFEEDSSLVEGVSSANNETVCKSNVSSTSHKSSVQSLEKDKRSSASSTPAERAASKTNEPVLRTSASSSSHKSTSRPESRSKDVAKESTRSKRAESGKESSVSPPPRNTSPRTKTAPVAGATATAPDRAASDKKEIVRKSYTSPQSRKATVVLARNVRDGSSTSSTSPERVPQTTVESVLKRNISSTSRKSTASVQSRKCASKTSLASSKSAGIDGKRRATPAIPESRVRTEAVSKRNSSTSSTSPERAERSKDIRKSSVASSCKSDARLERKTSVSSSSKNSGDRTPSEVRKESSSRASSERAASVNDRKDSKKSTPSPSPRSIVKFQKDLPKIRSDSMTKQEIVRKTSASPSSTKSIEQKETASRKSSTLSTSPERRAVTEEETIRKTSISSCKSSAQSNDGRKSSVSVRKSSVSPSSNSADKARSPSKSLEHDSSVKSESERKSSVSSSCKSADTSRSPRKSLEHESVVKSESVRKSSVASTTSCSSSARSPLVRKESMPPPGWNSSTKKDSPRKSSASPMSRKSSLLSQKSGTESPVLSRRTSSVKAGSVSPATSHRSSTQSGSVRKEVPTAPEGTQSQICNRNVSTSSQEVRVESLPSSGTTPVERSSPTTSRKSSARSEDDGKARKPSPTDGSGRRSNASLSSRKSSVQTKVARKDSAPASERASSTHEKDSRKSSGASQSRRSSGRAGSEERSSSPSGSGSSPSERKRKDSTSSQVKRLRTGRERNDSRKSSKSSSKSDKQPAKTETENPPHETQPCRSHVSLDGSWKSATSLTDGDRTCPPAQPQVPTSSIRHLDDADFEELQRGAQSVIAYISETVADIDGADAMVDDEFERKLAYEFVFPPGERLSEEMVLKLRFSEEEKEEEKQESSDDTLVLSPGSREKITLLDKTLDEFEQAVIDGKEIALPTVEERPDSVYDGDLDLDNRTHSSLDDTGSENLDFLGQEEQMLDDSWKNQIYDETVALLDRVYCGDLASTCSARPIIHFREVVPEPIESTVVIEEIFDEESQDDAQRMSIYEVSNQEAVNTEGKVLEKLKKKMLRGVISREEEQSKEGEIFKTSRVEDLRRGEVKVKSHGDEVVIGDQVNLAAASPELKETALAMGDIGKPTVIVEHATIFIDREVDIHVDKVTEDYKEKVLEDHDKKVLVDHVEKVLEDHVDKVAEDHVEKVLEDHVDKVVEDHVYKVVEDHVNKVAEDHVEKVLEDHVNKVVEDHVEKVSEDNVNKVVDEQVSSSGSTGSFVSAVDSAIMKNIKEFTVSDPVVKKSREMLDVIVEEDGDEEESSEEEEDEVDQVEMQVETILKSYDSPAASRTELKQKDAEISRLCDENHKLRLKSVSVELAHEATSAELVRLQHATKDTISKLHDQVESLQGSLTQVATKALESEASLLKRIEDLENEMLDVTYRLAEEREKRIEMEKQKNDLLADVEQHCDVLIETVRTPSGNLHETNEPDNVLTELRTLRMLQKSERLELERLRRNRDDIEDRLKVHETKVAEVTEQNVPPRHSIEEDVQHHHKNICERFGKIVDLKAEMKRNKQLQKIRRKELESTINQAQMVEEALQKVANHKDWLAKFKLEKQLVDLEATRDDYIRHRNELESQLFAKEMQLHAEEQLMLKQFGPLHASKMLCDFERTLRLKEAAEHDEEERLEAPASSRRRHRAERSSSRPDDSKTTDVLQKRYVILQDNLSEVCTELLRVKGHKKKVAAQVDKMATRYTASVNRRIDQEHRVNEIQEICEKRCRHVGYGRPAISWDNPLEMQEPVCIDLYRDLSHIELQSSSDSLGSDESASSSRQRDEYEYVY